MATKVCTKDTMYCIFIVPLLHAFVCVVECVEAFVVNEICTCLPDLAVNNLQDFGFHRFGLFLNGGASGEDVCCKCFIG